MKSIASLVFYLGLGCIVQARIMYPASPSKSKYKIQVANKTQQTPYPSKYNDVGVDPWESELDRERGHYGNTDQEETKAMRVPMPVVDSQSSTDMSEIKDLLMDMSDNIQELRGQLGNLKYQNHIMYKQMKKLNSRCNVKSNNNFDKPEKLSRVTMSDQPVEPKPQCPEEFLFNPTLNSCYKFANDRITWRMAREKCRAMDADLIAVETAKEQQFVTDTAKSTRDLMHCDFWIGASDNKNEGQWKWMSTGRPLSYSNWNHNEPNNGNGNEHCAHMLWVFQWKWNDARCTYGSACYVCEIKLKN